MSEVYTIRGLDPKTKSAIQKYAQKHKLKIAQAISQLITLAIEHIQHTKKEKKYKSLFDAYEELKFKGGSKLSKEIDEVVYR
jgi:hypothetical protein